jgi:hypothetical protein
MTVYPYRTGEQFKRVISQFMRVFSGFQAPDGNSGLRTIPVVYGGMDRIVASILQKRDHLTNKRVPMFAVNMRGISLDPNNKRPPKHIDAVRTGDGLSLSRVIGPSFILTMEVNIIASSNNELYVILEQILLLFNPRVTIVLDSVKRNSDYITEIILDDVQSEIQYPMGTQERIVQMGLTFSVPLRLRYPYDERDNIIKTIELNLVDEDETPIIETEIDEDGVN